MGETSPGSSNRSNKPVVVIVELLFAAALIIVTAMLILQNRGLKQQVSSLRALLYRQSSPEKLKEGDYVMEVRYQGLEGRKVTQSFLSLPEESGRKPLILALLRPDCGYCEAEVPIWNVLAKRIQPKSEFVAIAIGPVGEIHGFIERTRPEFPIFQGSDSLLKQLRAPGVPYLVRIASDGRVEEVVAGAHVTSKADEINPASLH